MEGYTYSMDKEIFSNAEILWNYMHLGQPVRPASALVVLGGSDDRVASYAAGLCMRYDYKDVIISGGVAPHNPRLAEWVESTEADHFCSVMREAGIVRDILLDKDSVNTGQDASNSYQLLKIKR